MQTRQAASSHATMPLLAINRKDTGGKSIGGTPGHRQSRLKTLPVWRYRGRRPHAVTQSWLHRLVIGPAAALRWNPGDVAVRILDVAGFAVNAVLGVDDEARPRPLLHPLVNTGRAIAIGRPGIDVMLGCFLQVHVGHLEVNRLVLFVIGVGKK